LPLCVFWGWVLAFFDVRDCILALVEGSPDALAVFVVIDFVRGSTFANCHVCHTLDTPALVCWLGLVAFILFNGLNRLTKID
jgi:hypothetical protein